MLDFYQGWFCQSVLLTGLVYSAVDVFQRMRPHILSAMYHAWWFGLEVYITADEIYKTHIRPVVNMAQLMKDAAVVRSFDVVSKMTDARLPRSIRPTILSYVNGCRERLEEPTTATVVSLSAGEATIPNPFISVSVQLRPSPSMGGGLDNVMNDIILPNDVVQRQCVVGKVLDRAGLTRILQGECKKMLGGRTITEHDLSTVTLLDNAVNITVLQLRGHTKTGVRFEADGSYKVVEEPHSHEIPASETLYQREESVESGGGEVPSKRKKLMRT